MTEGWPPPVGTRGVVACPLCDELLPVTLRPDGWDKQLVQEHVDVAHADGVKDNSASD